MFTYREALLYSLAIIFNGALLADPAQADEVRNGGKLILTDGITTIEGASGGGIATWSTIAGNATSEGVGATGHVSIIELPDYGWQSHGFALGLFDRVELSYARQNLDTRDIGAKLGIGKGYKLNQDVFGAKLRLTGDLVYGQEWVPQIAVGVQHKRNLDGPITAAVGAKNDQGTDYYISASKLLLSKSLLVNATARVTRANQNGLLGFGGDKQADETVQFEGSLGYMLSPKFVIGGEYRSKPDNLGVAEENDWFDVFAAYAVTRNVTVTAGYVDLGSIATAEKQRGAFLSLQAAF